MTNLLKDEDFMVRFGAAQALGSIGASADAALPDLEQALQDEDESVREEAEMAICDFKKALP